MILYIDIISTIIQSILVSYFPYHFLQRDKSNKFNKISISKLFICISLIYLSTYIITSIFKNNYIYSILMTIVHILIISIIYFKDYKNAIVSYGIIYFIIQSSSFIFLSINWSYTQSISVIDHMEIVTIISVYAPMIIIEICMFLFIDKIYEIYKFIIKKRYCFEGLLIVILSFDYILTISFILHNNYESVFKTIFLVSLIVFLFIVFMYFVNLNNKMNEIKLLNKALNEKNNELKKIKHDYGSQISYINGLYIMNQYERLGSVLKDIINNNENISSNVKVLSNSESIISVIVNSIDSKDINIIVEEDAHLEDLKITEFEIQKVVSNIINNAITAMDGNGLIVVKTYKIFNQIYISIKNDGPKIDDRIINKIFNQGFTTKGTNDNGFGLAIVKEIVEINDGKIFVESNEDYTEFKIIFKIKD